MKIRKFIAGSSREALRLVREALGDDAVVLSNRAIEGGVELVALAEDELASLASPGHDGGHSAPRAPRREHPAATAPHADQPSSGGFAANANGNPPAAQPTQHQSAAPAATLSAHSPQGLAAQNAQLTGALFAGEHYDTMSASAYAAPGAVPQPSEVFGDVAQARAMASSGGFGERLAQAAVAAPSNPYANGGYDSFASTFGQTAEATSGQFAAQDVAVAPTHAFNEPEESDDPLARALAARAALASINQHVMPLTPSEAASKGLGRTTSAREETAPQAPASYSFDAVDVADPPFIHRAHQGEESPARAAEATAPKRAPEAVREQPEPVANASEVQEALLARVTSSVLGEINAMRGALEEQLAGLQWSERQRRQPVRNQVAKTLLSTGFSAQFTNLLLDRMPPTLHESAAALEWARGAIERNLPVLDDEDAMMERGGVYALMGPTGVGKTTTTAKLAARCVMRFGAERVALLTTDSYRIGAHEQLRIYGKILGVSVHAVKDAADLKLTLDELRNKHIVLIDTIGMSQRDRALTEQVAMLCGTGRTVQRLLLLNATSHGDTLNEVVHAYRSHPMPGHQPDLAGCILTKLDEATNIGAVLDTVIRYRLPVHYVSTGQKVPENLYVARKPFLMKSAFCIPRESSPFTPLDDDFPVLMAGVQARSSAELSEVRFG